MGEVLKSLGFALPGAGVVGASSRDLSREGAVLLQRHLTLLAGSEARAATAAKQTTLQAACAARHLCEGSRTGLQLTRQ
jgi:hypothetical protein